MRRTVILIAALALGWCVAAWGKRTSTAPVARPAATEPAEPASSHAPAEGQADALRRARKVAALNRRLIELAKAGKFAECKPILAEALQIDPANATAWYNMACVHSRLGAPEEAIDCLHKALECGYSDFRHMDHDGDLDAIRDLPAYRKLLKRNQQVQRARAEKMKHALRERFGQGYIVEVDHASKLVFATDIDRQTLRELKTGLTAYAEAQWADLFTHRFEQYVTIIVPSSASGPIDPRRGGGYYTHAQRLLVARQIGMVLTHEFTHALHDADQDGLGQRHPIWIMEGLATLFESSVIADGHVAPQPNHRLNLLKRLIDRKRNIPWKQFLRFNQAKFMGRVMAAYPQCRYMMMYLHDTNRLQKWYDAYTAGYEADPSGAEALEQVFGKPLAQIEADWIEWVRRQESPPVRLAADSAYIGVRTRGQTDGLLILQVVPGSGADEAGLRPGDVIVSIDGRRTVDSPELLRRVSQHDVGDEIELRFRRNGQYETIVVTLGRWPGQRPATRPAPATTPATRPARKAA